MSSSEIEKSHSEQRLTLQLSGITKSFPGIVANDRVDFTLEEGEIHTIPVSYTHLTLPTSDLV